MQTYLLAFLLCVSSLSLAANPTSKKDVMESQAPTLAKEELFGSCSFISARISPNGDTIAYVGADQAGVSNLFLRSKDSPKGEQVSFFTTPAIIQFFWSGDSQRVLLLKDENGTGKLNLHGINIHSKAHTNYTDKFSKVNAKLLQISSKKNQAVIGLNHRNPHFHDLYVLDLESGDFTLLFENDLYAKFLLSDNLDLILKMRINEDGSWTVLTADDAIFMQLSPSEAFQTEFLSYNEKERSVYLLDNRFSDTNQLVVQSLSGKTRKQILGSNPLSDIDDVLFLEGEPKAYATYYTHKQWHIIDDSVKEDIAFLEEKTSPEFGVLSQSKNGDFWIIAASLPDKGSQFWMYDRKAKSLVTLYGSSQNASFAKMYPMVVESRDGKKLVCYYTLPKEYDQGGFVKEPIPLVVDPHGGPFKVRDKWGFNPYHQWLASRGYAVLSVNFRLSSGFGKEFVNAGNGEWGGKAHLDVIDAVEACIAKGITQRGKLAIFGGSYGGYEALASLTSSPDYFTCCVAICGPSNLKTVLDNVPKFWEFTSSALSDNTMFFTKRAFITSMGGDPDDPKGIEYLEKCSPLNHLSGVKAPLLLIHGKNDHIVAEKESEQIYRSLKKNGKEVTYILFPDEGHRFARFSNKMMYLDQAELFLSQHLGGKYDPVSKKILSDSSAQIFH